MNIFCLKEPPKDRFKKEENKGEIKASKTDFSLLSSASHCQGNKVYQRNRCPPQKRHEMIHCFCSHWVKSFPPSHRMYQELENGPLHPEEKNPNKKTNFYCYKRKIIGYQFFLWPLNACALARLEQINHCSIMNPLVCRQQSQRHLRATCTISTSSDPEPRWRGSCTSAFLPSVQLRDNGTTAMSYKPIMEAFSPSGLIWQSPHWRVSLRLHSIVSNSQERLNADPALTETD